MCDERILVTYYGLLSTSQIATATRFTTDGRMTTDEKVQFWAYDGAGNYIQKAALDGQGAKPLPDLCLACHGGFYSGATGKVKNAVFLPFDLETFLYDGPGDPVGTNAAAVQEQFRQLNAMVFNTLPDVSTGNTNLPIARLINVWYPGGVNSVGQQFQFGLNQAFLLGGFSGHELLYNEVVKPACRTCHVTRGSDDDWTSFSQMNTLPLRNIIRDYACGGGTPALHQTQNFAMPHAEVPFKKFWVGSGATLSGSVNLGTELGFPCPNQ